MNLTTVLVTLAIAGSATPGITKLALQPVIAQKRATNFGVAETQAVTFAAKNEGQMSLTKTPDDCKLQNIGGNAYTITCWEGKSKYRMSATRAFRQWTSAPGTGLSNLGFPAISSGVETSTTGNEGSDEGNITTNVNQSYRNGTSHDDSYTTDENQSYGSGTSHNDDSTTDENQSYGSGTSHDDDYTTDENQSYESNTSHNNNYTTGGNQSYGSGTSHYGSYTTNEDQSHGSDSSYDEKYKTNEDHSSSDSRSHDEKYTKHEKQSSRDKQSTEKKEDHNHGDQR